MTWQLETALRWTEVIVAVSCLIQTFELLSIRSTFTEQGIWKWTILSQELGPFASRILTPWMQDKPFFLLLQLRWLCCVFLFFAPSAGVVLFLLLSSYLVSLRWRGTFNGGSDFMTFLVLSAVFAIRFAGPEHWIATAALLYLSLQLVMSYFVAGLVKLRNSGWRQGITLALILSRSNYEIHPIAQKWIQIPLVAKAGSWLVLLFECAFPLSFSNIHLAILFVSVAFGFHLLNAWVLGLNRFFWAWIAAYPLFIWSVDSIFQKILW